VCMQALCGCVKRDSKIIIWSCAGTCKS